ncbi:putative reverse transcriptase domain-containing protein [Tanacetum coccineum]
MAASAIAISFDSLDESVGSLPSWVILFGDIPSTSVVASETSTIAPVISFAAPVLETTLVASPTGLCGLVPYSGSDSDSPDEVSSPEHISPLPAISPFLCTDSSEALDSSDGPPSQDPYVATVARWRSKVTARPSSSSEFPIAPITAPSRIRRLRKRVRPLPARRLASRHASPHSSYHHSFSSSSSSNSLPVHSLGLDASDQAHSGSSTRDVSPRLCYPSRRAPRCSEAFRHWCASPLSTLSPVDSVPSSTPVMGSLAPTRDDLLPPRKRFRDSYLSEASIEVDVEVGPIETGVDIELGIGDGDDVRDHVEIDPRDVRDDTEEYEADASAGDTVEVVVDLMPATIVEEEIVEPAGDDSSDSSATRDGIVRSFEDMPIDLDDVVRNFYHHMSEVRIDRIVGIETTQSRLEADQLIASGERVSMTKRIYSLWLENLKVRAMLDIKRGHVNSLRLHMSLSQEEFRQIRRDRHDTRGRLRRTMTITRSGMTLEAIEELVNRRVEEVLAAHEATRAANALVTENQSQNGSDGDNGNGNSGNGNSGNGNSRNENLDENVRGARPVARECTYQNFIKCQPLNFKGTKEVVGLIRWFEKMETVFHISNCLEKSQVKYATCTLLDGALTWWNSHKRTIGTEAAFAMSWRELMKQMTEVYCPRNEIQKIEIELWNLTVKNNDLTAYTQRFQELAMMCTKMVPEEEDQVEKFIGGIPDNIQGNVIAAEPTRLQDAVRIANNLMDQKLKGYAVRNAKNNKRLNNNYEKNRRQQPPFKRQNTGGQNVARAYMAGNKEKKEYEGQMVNQREVTCFKCGAQGHYRKDCPKVNNQNHRKKARVPDARGKAYVLGGGDANPGSNTVTGTFLLNDHHAYMLFDSGADRSFVSNTFSALPDIIPYALDVSYAVELADRRTSETNTVLRGCTLGLLGHPFNIDPMPIEFGSFDVIIGMDWLAKNHTMIVCDEKIVRIPYENKILIVQGDKSDKEKKSTLSIISYVKAQKYIEKGCQLFLAPCLCLPGTATDTVKLGIPNWTSPLVALVTRAPFNRLGHRQKMERIVHSTTRNF